MLRLIDRYIIREILPPFATALFLFTLALQLPALSKIGERLIEKGVSWSQTAYLLALVLPQVLPLTLPIALLVGLLIAFGRLSRDSEYVAAQASGISVFRLCRPALVLGVVVGLASAYICQVGAPAAKHRFREMSFSVLLAVTEAAIRPGEFFEIVPGRVVYTRRVSGGGWEDVLLFEATGVGQPTLYVARRGRILIDREHAEAAVVLDDVIAHAVEPDGLAYRLNKSRHVTLGIRWDVVAPRILFSKSEAELTVPELKASIESLAREGKPTLIRSLALHERYAIPASCVAIALLGVALGATPRRSSKLGSFVLGLAVIFGGYVVMFCCRSLAVAGYLPPAVAAWLPNALLAAGGIVLLIRRSRAGDASPFVRQIEGTDAGTLSSIVVALQAAAHGRSDRSLSSPGRILDRYVARLYGLVFVLTAAALLFVFYVAMFTELSADLFEGRATLSMLLRYQWYATPQTLCYVIPLSALVASLATIGLLTMTSELVVMMACGVSLYRVSAPIVAAAVVLSSILFGVQECLLGTANRLAAAQRHLIQGESLEREPVQRQWVAGRDGKIYHYEEFHPATRQLRDLTTLEFEPTVWQLTRRTFAASARYSAHGNAGRSWMAHKVTSWGFGSDGLLRGYWAFEDRELSLQPPQYFADERIKADQLTYRELARHVGDLRARGLNVAPDLVSLRRKLSFPFVPLVMTLIAVPFATTIGRRGALFGVAIAVGLAFGFWITASALTAVGRAGLLDPTLAAWGPNLVFCAGAVYLLLTTRT